MVSWYKCLERERRSISVFSKVDHIYKDDWKKRIYPIKINMSIILLLWRVYKINKATHTHTYIYEDYIQARETSLKQQITNKQKV